MGLILFMMVAALFPFNGEMVSTGETLVGETTMMLDQCALNTDFLTNNRIYIHILNPRYAAHERWSQDGNES